MKKKVIENDRNYVLANTQAEHFHDKTRSLVLTIHVFVF